jgi:hypothetical protein
MTGTRALLASIGASVLLVAAAALSLLAVSAVFAFGGWSDPVAESARQSSLVLSSDAGGNRSGTKTTAIVLPARAAAERSRPAGGAKSAGPARAAAADQAAIEPSARRASKASFTPPAVSSPETQTVRPQAPAAPKKTAGEGVRTVGDGLSGKVQNAGDALAQITDPLLPPVTAATQKVLDLVDELLRRTTDDLGRTVDRVLPAQ